jgi:predicted XRE-type DNA-binding protein
MADERRRKPLAWIGATSKKNATKRIGTNGETEEFVHDSSGNVFADLGLPDPEERMGKAKLAHTICELINAEGLSQKAVAARLGIDQPKVSALMRGKLRDFSTERLMRFVIALDRDVVIAIRQPKDEKHPSVRALVEA